MTEDQFTDDGPGHDRRSPSRITWEIDEDERPTEAVVSAVAAVTNERVLDLEPLYNVVDPDHVNGICENAPGSSTELTFAYSGCIVSVTPTEVAVTVREDGTD